MDRTDNISVGQLVKSSQGRDKERHYLVIDVLDDVYLMVADGDFRGIEKPKKKKVRHLSVYNRISIEVKARKEGGKKITNLVLVNEIEKLLIDGKKREVIPNG